MLNRSTLVRRLICSVLAIATTPAFVIGCESPGGGCAGMIVFSSDHEGNPEIYRMHLDGSGLTRLTHRDNRDGYPECSPDGTKVAFYAYEESSPPSINVMGIDGENRTRLTNRAGARDASPTWSSDGSSIAFTRIQDEKYEVWIMDADGGNQRPIDGVEGFAPQWSPDGSLLAFATYSSRRDLCRESGWDLGPTVDRERGGRHVALMVAGRREDRVHVR